MSAFGLGCRLVVETVQPTQLAKASSTSKTIKAGIFNEPKKEAFHNACVSRLGKILAA
jgi:hypothetical protein